MTVTYLGSMTLAAAMPAVDVTARAGADGINAAMPDLQGRIASLSAAILSLPTLPLPSFADMLARAEAVLVAINLAIATPGLPAPPGFNVDQIAALVATLGELQVSLAGLNAKLAAIVQLQSLLAAAGIHVVAYDGAIGSLGSQLQTAVAAPIPAGHVNALALIATSSDAWLAMANIFKVSP